jgi:monoamine oxidase
VICTLPLGVLKERASEIFEPSLTTAKLQAIDRLMFGTVDKIILEYDRPFLNPGISEIMLLWDDRKLTAEEVSDPIKSWFRKIYSFTKISDTLLLGWISGKAAEHMESLDNNEVARVCTNILRRFLNDPFVPVPKTCIHTCWHSQSHTRGSYTSMAVGASQIDIKNLAEPITKFGDSSKVKIAFAGEHTHSSFYSTVHGAYLSGRTAAQAILESSRWEKQLSLTCNDTIDYSSWIQGIKLK